MRSVWLEGTNTQPSISCGWSADQGFYEKNVGAVGSYDRGCRNGVFLGGAKMPSDVVEIKLGPIQYCRSIASTRELSTIFITFLTFLLEEFLMAT